MIFYVWFFIWFRSLGLVVKFDSLFIMLTLSLDLVFYVCYFLLEGGVGVSFSVDFIVYV
jgi:hypothetical protein